MSDLKESDPARWYTMAKRIGAVDKMSRGDIQVQCLENMSNKRCADVIAEHFSTISNEYSPINLQNLPCYLPALPAPVIDEYQVYTRIIRFKKMPQRRDNAGAVCDSILFHKASPVFY